MTKNETKRIFLEGKIYNRLFEIGSKNLEIVVEDAIFRFTREAALLLSPKIVKHFSKKSIPFKIFAFQSKDPSILKKNLIDSFWFFVFTI